MKACVRLCLMILVCLPWQAWSEVRPELIISAGDTPPAVAPPAYAVQPQYVSVSVTNPHGMETGRAFSLVLPDGGSLELVVDDITDLVNGDRVYHGRGTDSSGAASLVLTQGEHAIYGRIGTGDTVLQLIAWPGPETFQGWLFSSAGLGEDAELLPDMMRLPRESADTRLSQALEFGTGTAAAPRNQVEAQQTGLLISQFFSRRAVRVGETVDVQLQFENLDAVWRYNLVVDVYFVREDADVVAAPANCIETMSLSLQPILRCTLGNLQPGGSTSVTYTVLAGEQSKPYILNTAIVGEYRSDAHIAVVDDIRTDTDGDGISDFNEALLGTDPFDPESVDHSGVTIDVVAFYTPDARALYPWSVETRINQLVSVANQVYADSGVGITLRPVYYGLVDYDGSVSMDTALGDIVDGNAGPLEDARALRSLYGGDLAILFKPRGGETRCGLANLGGYSTEGSFDPALERDYAWSAIAIDCPLDLVVAHELGHNMGLTHSHLEDGHGGTFDFSTGYGVESQFVTVMAYAGAFGAEVKIPRFSDPDTDCLGYACGRSADGPFGADAAKSLELVKYQIAAYYDQRVPDMPLKPIVTLSGNETSAGIAMAASTNDGLSFTEDLHPNDQVDIAMNIRVDPEHVGETGSFHVVVTAGNGEFFELTANGQFLPWDGNVGDLQGFRASESLRVMHNIKLVNDFPVAASLTGIELWIYAAYKVLATGELVYTSEPLVLRFLPSGQ